MSAYGNLIREAMKGVWYEKTPDNRNDTRRIKNQINTVNLYLTKRAIKRQRNKINRMMQRDIPIIDVMSSFAGGIRAPIPKLGNQFIKKPTQPGVLLKKKQGLSTADTINKQVNLANNTLKSKQPPTKLVGQPIKPVTTIDKLSSSVKGLKQKERNLNKFQRRQKSLNRNGVRAQNLLGEPKLNNKLKPNAKKRFAV